MVTRVLVAVLAVGALFGVGGPVLAQKAEAKKLNPYTGNAAVIQEGRKLYFKYGCSACHGVGGGGGMGLPLTDDSWKFGSDDETLFKLITGQIPESKMPKVFELGDDDVWKILAYVRTLYQGDPEKINW